MVLVRWTQHTTKSISESKIRVVARLLGGEGVWTAKIFSNL